MSIACTGCIFLDVWRNEETQNHWPRCTNRNSQRFRQFVTEGLNGCSWKEMRPVNRPMPGVEIAG